MKKLYKVSLNDEQVFITSSLFKAISYIRDEYHAYDDDAFLLEEKGEEDQWDEWLDYDGQNVYEHLYMHEDDLSHLADSQPTSDDLDIDSESEDEPKISITPNLDNIPLEENYLEKFDKIEFEEQRKELIKDETEGLNE